MGFYLILSLFNRFSYKIPKLKKDPTNEINNTLTITLNDLKSRGIIDKKLYKFLHP